MAISIKTHNYDVTRNTSPGRAKPYYIILHYTATDGASAENEERYFGTNPSATNASADFFVDDNEIRQYNIKVDTRYSWAVGDGEGSGAAFSKKCFNSNQISIEMSCTLNPKDRKWYISNATYKNAVELTKYLMDKYGIPVDRVIRHHDVSGKLCPNAVGWLHSTGSEDTWLKFRKDICSSVQTAVKTTAKVNNTGASIYRVRKSANDAVTQIGAYVILENAKKQADSHKGYKVFNMNGKLVYEPKSAAATKSVNEIAKEVISGKWGNGDERKKRLEAAGYNYSAVQNAVNTMLGA